MLNQAPNERLFTALCDACAPFGGVACGEDLARLMTDWRPELPRPSLARLIAENDVFHFRWRGATSIPMVQFHLQDLWIDDSIRQAGRTLGDHRDGWEVAAWFVCANDWLQGRRPIDLIDSDLCAVAEAARADRFVTNG